MKMGILYINMSQNNRMQEFIKFANLAYKYDNLTTFLKKYAGLANLDKKQCNLLILLYSLTYCLSTAIVFLRNIENFKQSPYKFWSSYKNKLVFVSDKKWVKINNKFIDSFFSFVNSGVLEQLEKEKIINIGEYVKKLSKINYFGRFSAFLFLEHYISFWNIDKCNDTMDWQKGDTATSGLFNVLKQDDLANAWDKQPFKIDCEKCDKIANFILKKTEFTDITTLETMLCFYRKLFKASRYLGFYSDREYEAFVKNRFYFKELQKDWDLFLKARKLAFPKFILCESYNKFGVRKELKKIYVNKKDIEWWKKQK